MPPAPVALSVARSPGDVVRIAAQTLTSAGFEITTSDEAGGILTARLTRSPETHGDAITCSYDRTSAAGRGGRATYTESIVARSAATGSEVTITPRVVTEYSQLPRLMGVQMTDSETDCVSAGTIERRVAAALTTP